MPVDTAVKIRLDEARKARWCARAASTGRSLSAFMRQSCDAAAADIDGASIRRDLYRLRRFVNAVSDAAHRSDQEGLSRLVDETVEVRRILDQHLVIGASS